MYIYIYIYICQLDNSGSMYHLSWLPPSLPGGLRCVVSTNISHLPTTARLYEHPAYLLTLSALDFNALQLIASKYLGRFGKVRGVASADVIVVVRIMVMIRLKFECVVC